MADNVQFQGDSKDLVAAIQMATNAFKAMAVESVKLQQTTRNLNTTLHNTITAANVATQGQKTLQFATQKSTKHTQEFLLSWQSVVRLLSVQVIYRAVFSLQQQLQQAASLALDFEQAVAGIQTIDTARGSTEGWAQSLRGLSDSFGLDILDQAEGAYLTLSNQISDSTAQTEIFLNTVNEFALVTRSTTAQSVNALTGVLNAFGEEATEVEKVASSLFKTIELGRVRGEDLANLGNVSILASQLNIELEELESLISTITIQGVKASEAMTQIRGIFIKLLKPTETTAEIMEQIGFSSAEAAIEVLGLQGFLQRLIEVVGGTSTGLSELVPRIRGISGLLGISSDNFKRYATNLAELQGASENYARAVDLVTGTTERQLKRTFESIKNFLAQDIMQDIIDVTRVATLDFKALEFTVKSVALTLNVIAIPAILTSVVALGKFVFSARAAGAALTFLSGPVGLTFAGLTLLSQGLIAVSFAAQKTREDINELSDAFALELERINEERSSVFNEAIDDIARLNTAQINAQLKTSADVLSGVRDQQGAANQLATELEITYKNVIVEINRELTELSNNVSRAARDAVSELQRQRAEIERLQSGFSRSEFDISIRGLTPEQQLKRIQDQILNLRGQARGLIDVEGAEGQFRGFITELERLDRLQREILNKQGDQRSVIIDLAELQAEVVQLLGERETLETLITSAINGRISVTQEEFDSWSDQLSDIATRYLEVQETIQGINTLNIEQLRLSAELRTVLEEIASLNVDIERAEISGNSRQADRLRRQRGDAERRASELRVQLPDNTTTNVDLLTTLSNNASELSKILEDSATIQEQISAKRLADEERILEINREIRTILREISQFDAKDVQNRGREESVEDASNRITEELNGFQDLLGRLSTLLTESGSSLDLVEQLGIDERIRNVSEILNIALQELAEEANQESLIKQRDDLLSDAEELKNLNKESLAFISEFEKIANEVQNIFSESVSQRLPNSGPFRDGFIITTAVGDLKKAIDRSIITDEQLDAVLNETKDVISGLDNIETQEELTEAIRSLTKFIGILQPSGTFDENTPPEISSIITTFEEALIQLLELRRRETTVAEIQDQVFEIEQRILEQQIESNRLLEILKDEGVIEVEKQEIIINKFDTAVDKFIDAVNSFQPQTQALNSQQSTNGVLASNTTNEFGGITIQVQGSNNPQQTAAEINRSLTRLSRQGVIRRA